MRGWLGIPEIARAGTGGQTILVNGRWVSHPALGHALRQACGDLIAAVRGNRSRSCFLEVADGGVDVNVHPTKREIRFHDEGAVFAEVVRVVREATRRLVPGLAAECADGGRASGYVREPGPTQNRSRARTLLYGILGAAVSQTLPRRATGAMCDGRAEKWRSADGSCLAAPGPLHSRADETGASHRRSARGPRTDPL